MNIRTFALGLSVVAMAACSTVDRMTIADRLVGLGLSRDLSECMATELDGRLNDRQLNEFARFLTKLDQADSGLQAISSLREIEDPAIARSVTVSSIQCAIG